ncbi:MAG: hypothetical protein SF002_15150 [Alphaproteobacteria bacterium]|nr:hypothetical protein [Alphaproteobacteria bacterium]
MPDMVQGTRQLWQRTGEALSLFLSRALTADPGDLPLVLEKLRHCLENRFCFEQWVLTRSPVQEIEAHCQDHDGLLADLRDIIAQAQTDGPSGCRSALVAFRDRVNRHLIERDSAVALACTNEALWVKPTDLRRNLALWR